MLTPSVYAKDLAIKTTLKSLPRPSIIVDAGCSNGFHLRGIEADIKIGLDLNPLLVNSDEQGIKCDIRSIPIKSKTVNCIVALDVIEHIKEDAKVISEFHRILAENGSLVITTPNDSDFVPYRKIRNFLKINTAVMHQKWGHVTEGYSKSNILEQLGNNKLTILSYENIYQPFVQLMDVPYAMFLAYLNNRSGSQQAISNMKHNRLISTLEKIHDFCLKMVLFLIIPIFERKKKGGFLHLIVSQKN